MPTYNCSNCGNTTDCNCPNNPLDPPVVVCSDPLKCEELYSTDCIIYTGDDIECLSIVKGENMTSVIQKIAAKLCQCCTQPVNCVVSDWSAWSVCQNGEQTRTRTVLVPAQEGGTACPDLSETRSCTVCNVPEFEITNSTSSCRHFQVVIPGSPSGTSYKVRWKTSSGSWETSTTTTISSFPFTIDTYGGSALVAGTTFEVEVSQVCDGGSTVSAWAVSQFYTLPNCYCETPSNLWFGILGLSGIPSPTISMVVPSSAVTISIQLFDLGPHGSTITVGIPITAVIPMTITPGSTLTYAISPSAFTTSMIYGHDYFIQVTETCSIGGLPNTTLFNSNIVTNNI